MPCVSPLKGFVNKENGGIVFKRSKIAGQEMEVACGQCIGCRLDRRREWSYRIIHESTEWPKNCFVTLTYRNKEVCTEQQLKNALHVPEDGSLNKKHFQNFMKRLRHYFPTDKIRYYHCGEYGDQLDRPHYHACLFNVHFPDQQLFKESNGCSLFTSQILEDLWSYGFATVGALTSETAAYCAGYVTKKVTGKQAHEHYQKVNTETGEVYWLEPEYSTMSLKPGIGANWFERFKDDCSPHDDLPVPGRGVFKKIPRYYTTLLQELDPVQYEQIKQLREVFREAHGEEYTPARLMDKYKIMKAREALKQRNYEQ